MIKPLLRTIPTLSGNVKLACTLLDYNKINKDTFETNIRGAHIYPLSSQLFQKSVQANLLNSSWEYDLKRFYSAYSDTFFEPCFDVTKSEMPLLDKTSVLYPRNTDFEYGVKRISYSKSGCQYAFFAPIYIDNVDDIPSYFNINIKLTNSNKSAVIYKTIRVNIGINGQDDHNYIYKYLSKYISKLDNNVIYMDNNNESVIYYGIDLNKGGFTKFEDSSVSTLFNTKLPIQLFDYTISEGFKRNQVCMRQCLPLCFYFNVDEILTNSEKSRFIYGSLEFSGYYVGNDNKQLDLYDFSTDYDNFSQNILSLNTSNGIMEYKEGFISNIMDVLFPSFSDKWITNYQFANKLSKTFNRWRLKYSTDENPYITNMSWAFSKNQNNNYKYGIFPSNFTNQSAYAEINKENKYNLIFPIGSNISFYEKINPISVSKYEAIMNNYCVSWFDVIKNDNFEIFKDTINWADVDNGYAYYNGILYNLNYIYDRIYNVENKIDKFAFLVYPDVSGIQSESYFKTNIKYTKNIISTPEVSNPNVIIYKNFLESDSNINNLYDNFGNNYETTQMNLSFDGMLKPMGANAEIDKNKKYYIKTNDIYYNISTPSGNVFKTKNYYDINTIYRTDLLTTTELGITSTNAVNISDIYSLNVTAQINAIKHFANIEDNTYDELLTYVTCTATTKPELFDITGVGFNLTEILPAYKGIIYGEAIDSFNNTVTSGQIYINDNTEKFEPTIKEEFEDVNTNNGALTNTLGIQICKTTGRFINIDWLRYKASHLNTDAIFSGININERNTYIESFAEIYETLTDNIIKTLENIDTNSENYTGHIYYPIYTYDEKTIATNIAIRKQNKFDTSIEDTVYTEEMDDNVLYIHPFNIENIVKSFKNEINEEINNIKLYDKLVLDDIIYEKTVGENTENYIKNKYNIANLIIKPVGTNYNNITEDYIFSNTTDEELYQLDADVKCIVTKENDTITGIQCYLPNGKEDNNTVGKNYLTNVIARINTLIDEKNNELLGDLEELKADMYKTLNINFVKTRAILNNLDVVNVFIKANGTKFMECSAYESKTIEQTFYKQTKVINSKGDIKFKLVEITPGDTNIKFDKEKGLFYTITNVDGKDIKHEFNIVVETDFIKLNKKLFDYSNVENNDNSKFNDIYLFRPLTDIEYDDKFVNIKAQYCADSDLDNTTVLYPCFTSLFNEEKLKTLLYKNYVVDNITEVKHTPIKSINSDSSKAETEYKDTYYRYNVDNTALVIEVKPSVDNNLVLPTNIISNPVIYTEEFLNDKLELYTNETNNDYSKFNLITKEKDSIVYGYYLIKVKIDNSRNMFKIKGILDNDTLLSNSNADYIPNIKYITMINGINISNNKSYIVDTFKQLCPFLNINLLGIAAENNTIMIPKIFNLHEIYLSVLNNSIGAKEHKLVYNKNNKNKVSIQLLQRYTNAIVPYLPKVDKSFNITNLKYKNIQKSLLDTGMYQSIGDIVYDKTLSTIDKPVPVNIYSISYNQSIKDYNNIVDKYLPLEYKFYNNSKFINLNTQIVIPVKEKLKYEKLLEYQSNENTIKVFKDYLVKTTKSEFTDDEILFLYNKYNVLYDTNPSGIFIDGNKAYNLTYIFNLL